MAEQVPKIDGINQAETSNLDHSKEIGYSTREICFDERPEESAGNTLLDTYLNQAREISVSSKGKTKEFEFTKQVSPISFSKTDGFKDYNHPNYTNRSGFNSQHKNITVKRKLETSRTENIETKGEERYRDTIETFLNSQNDFNDNYHNNYRLRFDRSGSPLKRSVLGSVEMFEKERVKRTTYFKQSDADEKNKKRGILKSRLKDFNSLKPKSPDKKGEKIPRFMMTKFSDQQMKQFIMDYQEKQQLNSYNDTSSLFASTMRTNRTGMCFSVDRDNRDSRFLENYEKNRK